MTRERKKRGWRFWTTVATAGVVLYVLSIGPAGWLDRWVTGPGLFNGVCFIVYAPVRVAHRIGPQAFRDALDWYAALWGID